MISVRRITGMLLALTWTAAVCAQNPAVQLHPGQAPTDIQHNEIRTTLPDRQSADSLIEVRTIEVRTYIDTVRTVSLVPDTLARGVTNPDSTGRKGHYVEFHAGGGMGNAGYGWLQKDLLGLPEKSYEQAGISAVVQLQYAYFFHPNWGIGIGAWLSEYTAHGYINGDVVFSGSTIIDTDGENYTHHAQINRWHERQTIHTVGIPVSLQAQAWSKSGAAGFFASLGAAPAYAFKTNYHVLEGEIEHWGDYTEFWGEDAKLHHQHEFTTVDYAKGGSADVKPTGTIAVKPLITTFLDLGLLIRMSEHTDFLLGAYGQYTVNDVQAANLQPMGWKDSRYAHLDMAPYNGILATTSLKDNGALHPWQAGIKLGIHWHGAPQHARPQIIQRPDTTWQLVERRDTLQSVRMESFARTEKERVQREIDRLNRIYFAFDSYQLNDEAKQLLAEIAAHMQTVPNKVIIGGHASREGTRRHNEVLAILRATAVRNYLIDLGIDRKRLVAKGYGTTVPNAINFDNKLSLDRRVEIIVQDE